MCSEEINLRENLEPVDPLWVIHDARRMRLSDRSRTFDNQESKLVPRTHVALAERV